ncbi:hypothetical protein T484DRAFT_2767496 [Baffinella frigidus]|nr:hypothetical protein T484DRAFT_2767496 [Cryptophyta sp. CCMP2293]
MRGRARLEAAQQHTFASGYPITFITSTSAKPPAFLLSDTPSWPRLCFATWTGVCLQGTNLRFTPANNLSTFAQETLVAISHLSTTAQRSPAARTGAPRRKSQAGTSLSLAACPTQDPVLGRGARRKTRRALPRTPGKSPALPDTHEAMASPETGPARLASGRTQDRASCHPLHGGGLNPPASVQASRALPDARPSQGLGPDTR